jgi:hypothetical protein
VRQLVGLVVGHRARGSRRPLLPVEPLSGDDQWVTSTPDPVDTLLQFPDVHPYRKWWGTHWRLVELADLDVPVSPERLRPGIDQEVGWLLPALDEAPSGRDDGRPRRHASIEGNAVYALARLGFADCPSTRRLVDALVAWQWPDGGWNCDRRRTASRSSFHESVTPALGLAAYAQRTGDEAARAAADRTAELLLRHRLFRSERTGEPIHPSWTKPHYPPYWHYDMLQGLRLLHALGRLDDSRASEALDLLRRSRRRDGTYAGPSWASKQQPAALQRDTYRAMLTSRAEDILQASAG